MKRNKILGPILVLLVSLLITAIIIGSEYNQQKGLAQEKEKQHTDSEIENLKNEVKSLKERPAEIIKDSSDYSAIVAEWQDRVARVECSWSYAHGAEYQVSLGSGVLVNFAGLGTTLITNRHVILDEGTNYIANYCIIGIYQRGARIVNYSRNKNPFILGDTQDWAYIKLGSEYSLPEDPQNSDAGFFDKIVAQDIKMCTAQVNVGDKLVVLGYPAIGSDSGITATDGIVSGIEDDYYVTSAKIDYGNSGGAAILLKDNCYLGIPTWVAHEEGGFESLGRILKSSFALRG